MTPEDFFRQEQERNLKRSEEINQQQVDFNRQQQDEQRRMEEERLFRERQFNMNPASRGTHNTSLANYSTNCYMYGEDDIANDILPKGNGSYSNSKNHNEKYPMWRQSILRPWLTTAVLLMALVAGFCGFDKLTKSSGTPSKSEINNNTRKRLKDIKQPE